MMMGERQVGELPVRYYLLEEQLPGGDSAELRGITVSSSAIRRLLSCLMRCEVTPMSLRDIVDDWLISEYHS